ncbi:MAG TPA: ABC transporter ATP-binding protein [Hyphomicrobiales bacterium]|nr:ABC transporter ATP-binding protein [Hyphomicrobiales bacterium]
MTDIPSDRYILKTRSRHDAAAVPLADRTRLILRFGREFLRPHLPVLLVAVAAMALYAATVTALPWLFKQLVDKVFVQRDLAALDFLVMVVVALFAARAAASFIQQYLLAKVGNHVSTDLQLRLADHMLGLDLAFFQKNNVGQIVSRATEDVNILNRSAVNVVVVLVRDLVSFVGLVGYVLWTSPQWFALALLGGPLIAVPAVVATQRIRRLAHHTRELNGELIGAFEECFHGIRGIKAEANEPVESRRLGHSIVLRRKIQLKSLRTQALLMPLVDVATAIALVAVLMVGGRAVMSGAAEPGELMAFVGALMLLYDPLRRLLQTNALLQNTMASLERIYEVLDLEPTIADRPGAAPLADPAGAVAFQGVDFAYDPNAPVLNGLDALVPGGKTVAFVGPSGSGKTTVLNLIARLEEPDRGRVTIGGQDIGGVGLASLRSALALVAQDALLFDATVRENIAYGRPDTTEEAVQRAARMAEADQFVALLPGGWDFRVGPRGSRLSGGQRQRLLIARAFLRDAPILMLDEATSALDGETEARIVANLAHVRAGRTTVVIAHRLVSVAGADLIHLIENGRIVESGTHAQLLENQGAYARALALQAVPEG